MNLNQIITSLFEERRRTLSDGLGDIAQAELYLQQAYEGRYFSSLSKMSVMRIERAIHLFLIEGPFNK